MHTGRPALSPRSIRLAGAVEVEIIADARVHGRDHKRLVIDGETHVTDETFVQDLIDCGPVIHRAIGLADNACAVSDGK
jgi:hypothetical protein